MMKLKPMSVSKVNRYIHNQLKLDPILNNALVVGEISNFKAHSSGHLYFSIKDDASKINCIMFAQAAHQMNFEPIVGDQVELRGSIGVYEKEGRYQLIVSQMKPLGQGELFQAFMASKNSLEKKGYFKKNKKVFDYPDRLGVITSPTGAAIRDVLTVLKKRNPQVEIIIYPVHVQGQRAALEVASAVDYFNESLTVDTILIVRGGGSIEDLWAFNELILAEAVYASEIPIIAGIGHETDFTICDFVADHRGATPSEAAMLASKSLDEKIIMVDHLKSKLKKSINNYLTFYKHKYMKAQNETLVKIMLQRLKDQEGVIDNLWKKLHNGIVKEIDRRNHSLELIGQGLERLSPLKTLNRGYSMAMHKNTVISSIDQVNLGDSIDIIVKNGIIKTETVSKKEGSIDDKENKNI